MKYLVLLALVLAVAGCTSIPTHGPARIEPGQEELPVEPTGEFKSFTLEGDDDGFYPLDTLSVNRGDTVNITFMIRTTNVYYAGLEVRSSAFMTGQIPPGESRTVTFVADKSFLFTSHWPSTQVLKATGEVKVV